VLGIGPDFLTEGLVDVDEHLLLSFRDLSVGHDRVGYAPLGRLVLENPSLNVERLRRDPQALRDLLQDVGARPPQAALDLAEIGIGDTGRLS
jgi:hypothetical protein